MGVNMAGQRIDADIVQKDATIATVHHALVMARV